MADDMTNDWAAMNTGIYGDWDRRKHYQDLIDKTRGTQYDAAKDRQRFANAGQSQQQMLSRLLGGKYAGVGPSITSNPAYGAISSQANKAISGRQQESKWDMHEMLQHLFGSQASSNLGWNQVDTQRQLQERDLMEQEIRAREGRYAQENAANQAIMNMILGGVGDIAKGKV